MENVRPRRLAGTMEELRNTGILTGEIQTLPEGTDMKVTYILRVQPYAKALLTSSGLRVVSVWQDVKSRLVLTAISMTPIQAQ